MQLQNIDPAWLVQLQFQMHATDTSVGYLVSWSRTDISVHCIKYHERFVLAAAHVLKYIVEQFIDADELPDLPKSVTAMEEPLQSKFVAMLPLYKEMVLSCEFVSPDAGVITCRSKLFNTQRQTSKKMYCYMLSGRRNQNQRDSDSGPCLQSTSTYWMRLPTRCGSHGH